MQETKAFQTEVNQILELMIHSLYSHREIFLRELISNASDALDKLNFEEIQHPEWGTPDKHIRLDANPESKTLSISDNGIGMTREEVIQNLGTIAYSGTKQFVKQLSEVKERPELIGQFGVGFYSAFMVADSVTVHTQKAGTSEGTLWVSTGNGSYTIDSVPRQEGAGTTITLRLKDVSQEDNAQDFSQEWTLRSTVKKYSDFVEYPIRMKVKQEEPELDSEGKEVEGKTKTVTKDETVNSQKALWLRPAKEITKEEYAEFYKHISHDWSEPLDHIHYKAEGTQEFSALVYIPTQVPMDYNYRESKIGLSLYVKRIFITDHCEALIPTYLRFLKGMVDSNDLPLNVSRELIQKDREILIIKKALVSKVLRHLKSLLEKSRDSYEAFWKNFGSTLKEGISSDFANKKELSELVLCHSSHSDKWTSFGEYVTRMPANQKEIYFLTGDSLEQLASSPHLERLKAKGFEVLYLTDPVDEWMMSALTDWDGKKFVSITSEKLELDTEEEKKEKQNQLEKQEANLKPLLECIQSSLHEVVREVRLSDRLVDSPACLVSGAQDPSAHLERLMQRMGQEAPKSKRIFELNPSHPVIEKMQGLSQDKQQLWADILYHQALLREGEPLKDATKFSEQLSKLMLG